MSVPGFSQESRRYSFTHFSTANGLAANTITSIAQDGDGYIWISTLNGLQRYDGKQFITFRFRRNSPKGVPSDHLPVLFIDNKNRLWMDAENNKVGFFDTKKFTFTEVPIMPERKMDFYVAKSFSLSHKGEVLLQLQRSGIYRFNETTRYFEVDAETVKGPPNWLMNGVVYDSIFRKYWFSSDSGIAVYSPVSGELNYRGRGAGNEKAMPFIQDQTHVLGTIILKNGDVLFQTWKPGTGNPVLYRYRRKENRLESHQLMKYLAKTYHEINGMMQQRNERVWVYGRPFFFEWTNDERPFNFVPNEYRDEQSLKYDIISKVFEDRDNNLWILTDNGLFLFNPDEQIFNTYNLIRADKKPSFEAGVLALQETRSGDVLISCWGEGLFRFDKQFKALPLPPGLRANANNSIWDMWEHRKTGKIWMAMQSGELKIYDPALDETVLLRPDVFEGRTIRQVVGDKQGNLWMGTQSGRLVKWNFAASGGDPSKELELVLKTNLILKLHFDPQGYLWIGTQGRGLIKMDPVTHKIIRTYGTDNPEGERLFRNVVTDMTQYNDSIMVIGAGCVNIMNTHTGRVRFFSTEEGLPSNSVQSVQRDKSGIIWIGMVNGLCRLNLKKNVVTYYDRRDGIVYDNFNPAAVEEMNDGRIVFFTDHNFLVLDPDLFLRANIPNLPRITQFKTEGWPLSVDSIYQRGKAVLRYEKTFLSFHFSALNYLNQNKIHYFYKLEGFDKQWIHTDNLSEAVYNFLPPGEYVFKVKSENIDGETSREVASFPVVVRPPVWGTWWFYGLLILLGILILYLIDRERMKRLRSLQEMRLQIANNLHMEINTTLNNINVLSEIAKIKADRNVEQSKEFIDQISDKSRSMMEAMDDMLWSLDPRNDSMRKTLLRIKEVTEGIRETHGTDIDLIIDHKLQELHLDMKFRHELFFFYKEAITFLVENGGSRQIFVHLNLDNAGMVMEILSEGREELKGFDDSFRKHVASRVKAMHASLDVASDRKNFVVVMHVKV